MSFRFSLYGDGTNWYTYVDDGDVSYLHHHAVSIWNFSADTEHLSGRIWVTGRPTLSLSTISSILTRVATALLQTTKTMSLLHSGTPIVYTMSRLLSRTCYLKIAVMQEPFTELTRLRLSSNQKDGDMPVLLGAFLGGIYPIFTRDLP